MARVSLQLPRFSSVSAMLAVALVVASVVTKIAGITEYVALVPALVVGKFFVWQLVTYAFVETSPMGIIFGALILWSIGGALESVWSRQRFVRFCVGVVVAAALATVALGVLVPSLVAGGYAGGTVLTGALWVGYGLYMGRGQTNFWGIPVTGNVFALIGAGFVFLNAAFAGLSTVIPNAFALLFTFLWMRATIRLPSNPWTRFRTWQLERDLKRRSAHLKSIDGGRNVDRGSDKYLQ
jgi:membrane associated rhomboid family serine protease